MRPPTFREIGERIRAFREKQNITQEDLAKAIGLSKVVLTKIELGQRPVKSTELLSIAKALGVSMEALAQHVQERSLVARYRARGEVDEVLRADLEKLERMFHNYKAQLQLSDA